MPHFLATAEGKNKPREYLCDYLIKDVFSGSEVFELNLSEEVKNYFNFDFVSTDLIMAEIHPFGVFIPKQTKYLFLGSFVAKPSPDYDWFFGSKRSQFWSILQEVYGLSLLTKDQKQALFEKLGLAMADIILECERKNNNSLDTNLTNFVINTKVITDILANNQIKKIYFSSRFAENLFKRYFKDLIIRFPKTELVTLPSPSLRYAAMTRLKLIRPKGRRFFPSVCFADCLNTV